MTSFRRRKHPQHQHVISIRQLDSVPATGSAGGVTSSENKMATKMAAVVADTAKTPRNMAGDRMSVAIAKKDTVTKKAAEMTTKPAINMAANKMATKMAAVADTAAKIKTKTQTNMAGNKLSATMGDTGKVTNNLARDNMCAAMVETGKVTKKATEMGVKTTINMAANKMATKMAAADIDVAKKDRRPSLVDLRNVLSLDDFDTFCAQASSGGSIYGMLRRQIYSGQDAGGRKLPPEKRSMLRQRSKSLIQRSVALSEEKSIIKLLCDYTETAKTKQRLLRDNRRHSEVTITSSSYA